MSDIASGNNARFQCLCGQPVYFRNSVCLKCSRLLGYDPVSLQVCSLSPEDGPGLWLNDQTRQRVKRCSNLELSGCNWLEPADSEHDLCVACRLTRTIPDLSLDGNQQRWRKIELEKRRVVAQLLGLGLPIPDRTQDPEGGLVFDLLGTDVSGETPMTGHANGLITLNIQEADDDYRARVRESMGEPYRTLLGHFRHEIGHFYWDVLIKNSRWLEPYRTVFGDETGSYQDALDKHYHQGPPADWHERFVSSYATMHPWEDWAETWAHYLHMMATLDTAASFGMHASDGEFELVPFGRDALYAADDADAGRFLELINRWIELAAMLNVLARSMGQPDIYPFALPATVVAKLQFVHMVVGERSLAGSVKAEPPLAVL